MTAANSVVVEELLVIVQAPSLWYLLKNAPNVIDKDVLYNLVRCIEEVRRLNMDGHFLKTLHNQFWKLAYGKEEDVHVELKNLAEKIITI